jgi:hypothetical protein
MAHEPRPAPPVALVVRWAMLQRRRGIYVPCEVLNLLVALAERRSAREGCSRPGNYTLAWDSGIGSKDTIRKWLQKARDLGAITYRPGRGRGRASEVRFTADVLDAPQLDYLSRLDQVRLSDAAAKGQRPEMPAHPLRKAGRKGRGSNAVFESRKGRRWGAKRATGDVEKGDTVSPSTAVRTACEPLVRPSTASISSINEQPNGNGDGALTEVEGGGPLLEAPPSVYVPPAPKPYPPPRREQIRQRIQGSGRYVPLSEDEEAARRALLAEQKGKLLKAAGVGT